MPPESERPLRVLIIDDSRDAAHLQKILLIRLGHEVRVANSGPEGLETARSFEPDIVLCDIGLPNGMDGYQVATQLRSEVGKSKVFLVAVTGFARDEDRQRAAECGFDEYLTKPASLDALKKLLSERQNVRRSSRIDEGRAEGDVVR